MANILIIAGSETGTTFNLTDDLQQALCAAGHEVSVNRNPLGSDLTAQPDQILLVCTSTTGFGELPTNLRPLESELINTPPAIAGRQYGVISLGDSCYDFFCMGGEVIDNLFADLGAIRVGERLVIDGQETFEPETIAVPWALDWVSNF